MPTSPTPPPSLSGIYVEAPGDVFVYEDDWLEAADGVHQPGGGTTSGYGNQEGVLVGYIPHNKQRSAKRYFVGGAYADAGPPYALHREQPAPHPIEPQLRAVSCSCSGFMLKAQPGNPNNSPYVESPFPDQYGEPMYYTSYEYALCTVRYKGLGRMRFLPDEDIGGYQDEYKRNCMFTMSPQIQTLECTGGFTLTFAEGAPFTSGPGGAAEVFGAPLPELMGKADFAIKWFGVPHAYVSSDPDVPLLDKITSRLGTVNGDAFLGFNPGVLLLKGVKVDETSFPLTASDPTDYPLTGYDLTLVWEYFNPPKGVAPDTPEPDDANPPYPYYGHRLFPWKKTGRWYYAVRSDTTKEYLPLTDHWAVFSHALDPSTSTTPVTP